MSEQVLEQIIDSTSVREGKLWWHNDESQTILNRGYLLKGETVEDAIFRITYTAAHNIKMPELQPKFQEMIELGWMSLSSPTWANMGTERGLPISCFNSHISDSVESITDKLAEVIMQTKFGGGTSGYFGELRERGAIITDNGKSSGAVSFMELFNSAMNVVSQGSCYQEGTKVLTQRGFVDFREVTKNDLLAQLDENNNITFTKQYELVVNPFKGKLVNIKGKKRDDLVSIGITPNHRMVIERRTKTTKGRFWKGYTEIVKAEDLKLHRDNRVFFSGKSAIQGRGLSSEEKFLIAFQADGRKDWSTKNARFRFKKERKISRLISICEELNLDYVSKLNEDNSTEITVYNCSNLKKELLNSWIDLTDKSYQWCNEFIEEIALWDGSNNKNRTSISYSSIIKSNVEIVQAISTLCEKRSRITTYTEREGNRQDLHTITISDVNKLQGDSCEIYETDYNGNVYCAIVPNGRLLVEYNGRTLVCGNTRRGAFAAYLDIDHPDIEEFLEIKSIGSPIQNIFFAVCIPDYWMQEMIDGDESKRQIWVKVLEARQEKGLPYLFFVDNANKNKPLIYKECDYRIKSSNLCSEIMLPSNEEESFVCCLASMNLELYDEWKDTEAVKLAIWFLDGVMQEFINKSEAIKHLKANWRFSFTHRALGLGVLGWHSYLQKNNIAFDSHEAKMLTTPIFKNISEKAFNASVELGDILGYAPIFYKDGVTDTKRRNTTLMAIAPTTSSSAILGQSSPGIEPFSSNYYKVGTAKGNFIRKNFYLQELLESKGQNTDEVWRSIMLNGGSVQHLDILSQEEKDVFKTFKEISQLGIVQQAIIRQKYIDQGQSVNLNIPPDLPIKEVNKLYIEAWQGGMKAIYYQRSQSVSKELVTNLVSCSSCEA